ncbi:DUF4192 domain-containing protein [Paeniglutamicibacter antarcticus]|uniref:DUF4192 domain-containing protein n=1 Tax=Arthrobacter terrae TaxID=2935737 RepID=A0A931CNU3_9MICC|nr:DUF4192 domain-containing protein [Arthrobacter terrae]MBG0741633.1 DUF4192 domain-containing protein [Arthrobacter terrae]
MTTEQRLSVRTGEDILSYIAHAVGYWPTNSLVCLTLDGGSVGATLRVDLPRPGGGGLRDFADYICSTLGADEAADGVLVAVFGQTDWQLKGRTPYREMIRTLGRSLAQAGMPVRDKWYVGPEHWRNYLCGDAGCCGWPGRPLEDITNSALNAELVFRGSALVDPVDRAGAAVVTPADVDVVAVQREVHKHDALLAGRQREQAQFKAVLQAWELAILRWPEPPTASSAGYLLASLQSVTIRDSVLVLASVSARLAFGGALACRLLIDSEHAVTRPAPWDPNRSEQDALRRSFSQLQDDRGQDLAVQDFGSILVGEGASDPDWQKLDVMDELLTYLSRAGTAGPRAAVLTMLAWTQWCRGRGSSADAYLQLALREFGGYPLAVLLEELISRGSICNWARNRRTSWRKPA